MYILTNCIHVDLVAGWPAVHTTTQAAAAVSEPPPPPLFRLCAGVIKLMDKSIMNGSSFGQIQSS